MSGRWVRVFAALLVLGAAGFGGSLFLSARPVSVTVAEPEQDVAIRVFGLGTVEARIVSRIGFEVGGAVTELAADHGDTVAKGEQLARLYTKEQEAKVARADAGIVKAQAGLKKAHTSADRARTVLAQRQDVNRRQKALVGRNIVSEQTALEAQSEEDIATAELAVALGEIEVNQAQLADARAALAYERTLLDYHILTAPFDAVVIERHKEAGSVIKAGDAIYTLIAPETVWVLAHIDEGIAGSIEEGQEAEVRLRSLPQRPFKARVSRIGIESDRGNEERRVWVKCEQCPLRIHLGEQTEVRITVAHLDRALLVPEAAVSDFDGRNGVVWIIEDERLARIGLTFGHRTEDARLEVVGGLPAGAQIVAAITPGLKEGRLARIAKGAKR
jgi:HlyD family secretion protein